MTMLPSLFSSKFRGANRPWANLDEALNNMLTNFKSEIITNGSQFALDVEETDDSYLVEAELPGIDKKNVDVTLQDHLLSIKINESGNSEKKERNFVCKERWEGSAIRSISLPFSADSEAVDAALKDGVLKVTVKKLPASRTKKIAIQ